MSIQTGGAYAPPDFWYLDFLHIYFMLYSILFLLQNAVIDILY